MAKFDESKVINALHPEKAEIGKKYWFADDLLYLKKTVEKEITPCKLHGVNQGSAYPFEANTVPYQFLYPYEEPPKQRMTNRQLAEWLAKSNGEYTDKHMVSIYFNFTYSKNEGNDLVDDDILIRTWDSEEWIEPTVDIYERDCKGEIKWLKRKH